MLLPLQRAQAKGFPLNKAEARRLMDCMDLRFAELLTYRGGEIYVNMAVWQQLVNQVRTETFHITKKNISKAEAIQKLLADACCGQFRWHGSPRTTVEPARTPFRRNQILKRIEGVIDHEISAGWDEAGRRY